MTNRAANSRSPFTTIISRARTPALMLAAAANATATPAPASLYGLTMLTDGWLFAVSARDSDAVGSRLIRLQDNHFDSPYFTALTGVATSSLRSSVGMRARVGLSR